MKKLWLLRTKEKCTGRWYKVFYCENKPPIDAEEFGSGFSAFRGLLSGPACKSLFGKQLLRPGQCKEIKGKALINNLL